MVIFMKKEKISVVIPTYNREKLIVRSIESVLKQTYKNIEVIVVDDASDDNTKKVVKKIKDERIKYIKLESNKGACYARNVGIENASGKYVAFQDSDDVFHEDKIEKQYNNLIKNGSDIDFCKLSFYDDDVIIPNEKVEESILKGNILDELCRGNFISTQAILMKKSVALKYLFDVDMPRFQDFDFIMRLIHDVKISYTKEALVTLFKQNDSISSSYERLKKASLLILKKNYRLNDRQLDDLRDWILNCVEYSFDVRYIDLKKKYINLENKYSNLENEYNKQMLEYNNIISSKRWKVLNKILKIFRR